MNRKYRKTIIAGNWKMNLAPSKVKPFAEALFAILGRERASEVALCVPAVCVTAAAKPFKEARISVGAQNLSERAPGAFTGEISAGMLGDAGVKYVIVGHSERRALFGETDAVVNAKALAALGAGLTAIICVGESGEQRAAGVTKELLSLQVKTALAGVKPERLRRIVIAYEPLWAIGTGVTATPEQAGEACAHIRAVVRGLYGARHSRAMSILYGGSMNEKNAAALLAMPDVDGGLIGGASLDPVKFAAIVKAADPEDA